MKKSILFIFTVLLAMNLSARMNPFEPTDTFFEQQKEYEQIRKQEEEKQLELEKQRKLELLAQQEAEEKAEQLRLQQEQAIQLEKQRKLAEEQAAKLIKVVEKKEEVVVPKDSYKILPFVNIKVSDDELEVFIDKRYKLINQDILEDQKKFLFDFRATESFYTVRKILKSKDFKSFAVGTHMEKNFFRVVVELNDNVSKYKEYINSNTSYIKIKKIK
jgi:hypothetical protein